MDVVLAAGDSVADVAEQVVVVECNVELGSVFMWFVRQADEDNFCVSCTWDALLSVRPRRAIKRVWVCVISSAVM